MTASGWRPQPGNWIRISSGGPSTWQMLREAVGARELLVALVWRMLRIRYAQAAFGVGWAVLQPALAMAVFAVVFGRLARMPSNGVPYAMFAYAGLLPWTFFANAVNSASDSLAGQAGLLTRVYLPRILLPAAAVASSGVDLLASYPLLGLVVILSGRPWQITSLLAVPLVLLTALLALGVGLYAAALNARYRDVRYALPFLMQMWLFATPVIYPLSIARGIWRWLLLVNPLTGIVEAHRAAVLGAAIAWDALGASLLVTATVLFSGLAYFRRVERTLADVV